MKTVHEIKAQLASEALEVANQSPAVAAHMIGRLSAMNEYVRMAEVGKTPDQILSVVKQEYANIEPYFSRMEDLDAHRFTGYFEAFFQLLEYSPS